MTSSLCASSSSVTVRGISAQQLRLQAVNRLSTPRVKRASWPLQGYSSMDTFRSMSKSVTLSDGILSLMHEYHSILVAATVVATLALAAYVPIICLAIYRDMAFDSAEGALKLEYESYHDKQPAHVVCPSKPMLSIADLLLPVIQKQPLSRNINKHNSIPTYANCLYLTSAGCHRSMSDVQ